MSATEAGGRPPNEIIDELQTQLASVLKFYEEKCESIYELARMAGMPEDPDGNNVDEYFAVIAEALNRRAADPRPAAGDEQTAMMRLSLNAAGVLTVEVSADPPKSQLHELVSEVAMSLKREMEAAKGDKL